LFLRRFASKRFVNVEHQVRHWRMGFHWVQVIFVPDQPNRPDQKDRQNGREIIIEPRGQRPINFLVVTKDTETNAQKVAVKKNKEVPSDSLQNPSDPDATYDAHKGKGYQVQILETFSTEEEKEGFCLITHAKVEQAHKSDAHALLPALEDTEERNLAPELILADTLYGGDDNVQTAKAHGVEVIAPVMGKSSKKEITLSDFALSEEGEVTTCPQGEKPQGTRTINAKHRASFNRETCAACPLSKKCPVKITKKKSWLEYDSKAIRLAKRRAYEKTDEFKNIYRHRSGIEGTNSFGKRRTGLEELRVRGKTAVSFAVMMKLTGINILRASAFKIRKERVKKAEEATKSAFIQLVSSLADHVRVFKEQICFKYLNYTAIRASFDPEMLFFRKIAS
jgi:hypothetical protein